MWVKNILKYLFILFGSFLAFLLFFFLSLYFNWFGVSLSSGDILEVNNRTLPINEGSNLNTKKILFGDLHVHSSFSLDAYLGNLPLLQGEGAHPISDACDYARFCSNIDFSCAIQIPDRDNMWKILVINSSQMKNFFFS